MNTVEESKVKGQPTIFNKAIILVTGVISFAVLAGAVQDIRRNTADFMTHSSTINTRLDEHPHFSRNLASQKEQKKPVVFCGDLNVAHQEIDLSNPKENKTTLLRP